MIVAFDVQGTLKGRHSDKVKALLIEFANLGAGVFIWSFGGSMMAEGAMYELNLENHVTGCVSKKDRNYDNEYGEPETFCDLAIDDDPSVENLSCKEFILVKDLPEDIVDIRTLALKYLLKYADKEVGG